MRTYPIIQEALAGEAISVATLQPLSSDQEVSVNDLNLRVPCSVYMSCHESDFFPQSWFAGMGSRPVPAVWGAKGKTCRSTESKSYRLTFVDGHVGNSIRAKSTTRYA